jgi:hypothetical protein
LNSVSTSRRSCLHFVSKQQIIERMAERWFDRDGFRVPLAISLATGVLAIAGYKSYAEVNSSGMPRASYEGQLINGLRAVDDGNTTTRFNTSGLKMMLAPPVVELGFKDVLKESAQPIDGDIDRAKAILTCAAVAINNPGTETADNSAAGLALSEGINTIGAGEESEILVEDASANGHNHDSAALEEEAKRNYSHAASVCLRFLEKSSALIKIPVGTK